MNNGKHGQRTHSTKLAKNIPNAPKFICPNCLPKPKSLGFLWKKVSLGVRSPWVVHFLFYLAQRTQLVLSNSCSNLNSGLISVNKIWFSIRENLKISSVFSEGISPLEFDFRTISFHMICSQDGFLNLFFTYPELLLYFLELCNCLAFLI